MLSSFASRHQNHAKGSNAHGPHPRKRMDRFGVQCSAASRGRHRGIEQHKVVSNCQRRRYCACRAHGCAGAAQCGIPCVSRPPEPEVVSRSRACLHCRGIRPTRPHSESETGGTYDLYENRRNAWFGVTGSAIAGGDLVSTGVQDIEW